MQISYDRQLSEISAYRNRILLFQVSMMLRKTQLDLYIITGEFSSNSARVCIRVNNTVNFRSRDRLTPKSIVGSISASTSCRVVLPPSRSDPPSTFNKKKKTPNFPISRDILIHKVRHKVADHDRTLRQSFDGGVGRGRDDRPTTVVFAFVQDAPPNGKRKRDTRRPMRLRRCYACRISPTITFPPPLSMLSLSPR